MIGEASIRGVREAISRFNVREASALQSILGMLGAGVGGSVARGALNAASPRLMSTLENAGAAPVNAIRRAITAPSTPHDAFVRHLETAQPMMPKAPIR
jgi:hypothetical protein